MFTVRRIAADEGATLRAVRLQALADAPGDAATTVQRTAAFTDDHWTDAAVANASGALQATFFAEVAATDAADLTGSAPDRAVVGMVGCYANRDGVVNLVGVWAAPGHRGVGVADALVAAVAGWAREQGCTHLRQWLVERNAFARGFYEGLGFAATGVSMPYELDPRLSQVELLLPL